jgi:Bifunctional DNA primase/polymerase, N-terminal
MRLGRVRSTPRAGRAFEMIQAGVSGQALCPGNAPGRTWRSAPKQTVKGRSVGWMSNAARAELACRIFPREAVITPLTKAQIARVRLVSEHAAGFSPSPLNGKVPAIEARQKQQDTTDHEIEFWSRIRPAAMNTGILTRLMPMLDIDILDEDAAAAVEHLVPERFGETPPRS